MLSPQRDFFIRPGSVVAGVDEVGRGPLAGPVVAAAVILHPRCPIDGVADSKQLSARRREALAAAIQRRGRCWAIAWADREEIDSLNILQASLLAMRRAVLGLGVTPDHVQVDGNRCPSFHGTGLRCSVEAVVKGDASIPAISAASILAKVFRDRWMDRVHRLYPQYGFSHNKGYATKSHSRALAQYGPCPLHRRSFRPLRAKVQEDEGGLL